MRTTKREAQLVLVPVRYTQAHDYTVGTLVKHSNGVGKIISRGNYAPTKVVLDTPSKATFDIGELTIVKPFLIDPIVNPNDYNTDIKKGDLFYSTQEDDVVTASYPPSSKISSAVLATPDQIDLDYALALYRSQADGDKENKCFIDMVKVTFLSNFNAWSDGRKEIPFIQVNGKVNISWYYPIKLLYEFTPHQIDVARNFYREHKEYIDKMVKYLNRVYAPSPEDKTNPLLWKDYHWGWFLTTGY